MSDETVLRIAQIVRLRAEGLTLTHIAAQIGCTKGVVAGILYRSRDPHWSAGYRVDPATGKEIRGFAGMTPDEHMAAARKGGASVPAHLRTFSKDRSLAAEAGRAGGLKSRGGGRPRNAR